MLTFIKFSYLEIFYLLSEKMFAGCFQNYFKTNLRYVKALVNVADKVVVSSLIIASVNTLIGCF